jgi:hypothetical protein
VQHKQLKSLCVCATTACRLVQEPGTFVVLLPNAYHCWLSTGLSIHESVALAPWDCLGAGCDAERSCRAQAAPPTVSQTELLVTLVSCDSCVTLLPVAADTDIGWDYVLPRPLLHWTWW